MKIYGLTGGIGSGKTTVAKIFETFGVPGIDADQIAKKLREPGEPAHAQIQARFGTTDRVQLRSLLSEDSKAKKDLEKILHPLIKEASDRALQDLAKNFPAAPFLLYEASLLIEAGRVPEFDGLIVVVSDPTLQQKRVSERDQTSSEAAQKMIGAQLTDQERIRHATFLIENKESLEKLRENVKKILEQIQRA